jgi:hypothetical protein
MFDKKYFSLTYNFFLDAILSSISVPNKFATSQATHRRKIVQSYGVKKMEEIK